MSLLDVILGGSNAAATMPNGNQYDYDADGNLLPKAPAAPVNQAPITVTGRPAPAAPDGAPADTWRPKKAGLLGQIADYLFDTHFGKENVRRNMQGALEHLTSNPAEAIKRLNQVDPDAATALWDKVKDNQRADDAQARMNKMSDLGIDKYIDQYIAGTLNRATQSDSPETMWPKAVARAREIASRYGKEINLPDIYDPMDADLNSMGVIPPAKQITLKQGQQRLDDNKEYREKNLEERTRYNDGRLQIGRQNANTSAARAGEQGRHNRATEDIQRNPVPKPKAVDQPWFTGQDPNGHPYKVKPDQTELYKYQNGKVYRYINVGKTNGNINWKLAGEVKKK